MANVFSDKIKKADNKDDEIRVRLHNQNITAAARAQTDRKTPGHLS